VPTPRKFKHAPKESWAVKPRGVLQRNMALQWLRGHLDNIDKVDGLTPSGVLYFADDDNVYDLALFDEVSLFVSQQFWDSLTSIIIFRWIILMNFPGTNSN
jgi:hypothetical protein